MHVITGRNPFDKYSMHLRSESANQSISLEVVEIFSMMLKIVNLLSPIGDVYNNINDMCIVLTRIAHNLQPLVA
jgi:hypothetical protein